jgi:hypothetical protein
VFPSRFMPCEDCGASIDRYASQPHRCDAERRVDYQMFALRDGVERFEAALARFLASPAGEFEAFLAGRRVRGEA